MRKLILILSILFLYSCDDYSNSIVGLDCIDCTDPYEWLNEHEGNPECIEQGLKTCSDWTCVENLSECGGV